MSISAQAGADFLYNTLADGDDVLLVDSTGQEYSTKGWVRRTDMQSDPDTGAKVYDPKTTVTVPAQDVTGINEDWTVTITDGNGVVINGIVRAPHHDHTMRFIIFEVELYE